VTTPPAPLSTRSRLPTTERRELILQAATDEFGRGGYAATTTDQIARAAGISQPYVVRMFGTKEKLFVEVVERAISRVIDAFRAVLASRRPDTTSFDDLESALGAAYINLVTDRGINMSLMQAFVQGHDPVIGAHAREGFLTIYRLLRDEAGFNPEQLRAFLAQGMLFNTLLAVSMPGEFGQDEAATELITATFGSQLDTVMHALEPKDQAGRPVQADSR